MNDVVNGNTAQAIAQVFLSKNGPILGGILGIITLVGMYYVIDGNYRLSSKTENGGFSFEPAQSKDGNAVVEVEVNSEAATEEAVNG